MTDAARRSPWGAAALALLMGGMAAWLVANSALFAARDIRVLGNVRLTAQDVQRLAGVSVGDNLVRLGVEGAIRSLERSPWVAQATIERSLPSTLLLRVVERRPAAWMRDAQGVVLVAGDGTVLGRTRHGSREVPFVGRWGTVLQPGQRILVPAVLRAAGTLPAELASRIRAVTVDGGELILSVRGGAEARYGDPTALVEKHRVLSSVLAWARDHRVSVSSIDLRVPRSPAVQTPSSRG